ncbi:MAG: cupin domain-containing protein [Verrucomicrobia bacterium]|nr:cupin domain-containing protein [Verrucomicrobiota bacterium]
MSSSSLLPAASAATLSLPDMAQTVGHGIVSRTVLATPEMRVVWFSFAAGQSLTEHTNPARALVQVLGGACEFTVEGKVHTLRTGDLLHFPPNAPHAVVAAEAMTMLLTLTPVRSA